MTASGSGYVRPSALGLLAALALSVSFSAAFIAQSRKDFSVSARKYSYKVSAGGKDVPEVRVQLDDMVTVTFSAEDIAHSFTIGEHYRIDRRAEPGKPVTIRFRADKEGPFDIRCTLTIDDQCLTQMRSRLVVEAKK